MKKSIVMIDIIDLLMCRYRLEFNDALSVLKQLVSDFEEAIEFNKSFKKKLDKLFNSRKKNKENK